MGTASSPHHPPSDSGRCGRGQSWPALASSVASLMTILGCSVGTMSTGGSQCPDEQEKVNKCLLSLFPRGTVLVRISQGSSGPTWEPLSSHGDSQPDRTSSIAHPSRTCPVLPFCSQDHTLKDSLHGTPCSGSALGDPMLNQKMQQWGWCCIYKSGSGKESL